METNQIDSLISLIQSSPAAKNWEKIGIKQHHGINIPLFSLHSKKSAGIGEYTDLIPMIDWCKSLGLDVLQLLPLNDTGLETSPYSALSAFALNPLHIGLASLPYLEENTLVSTMLKDIQQMTASQRIDYPQLHSKRSGLLHQYFTEFSEEIMRENEYQTFVKNNPWLQGYALFKSLKMYSKWKSWELWPDDLRNPTPETVAKHSQKYEIDMAYHIFLQYLCFKQMQEAKKHAESQGIFLKGDIPILINRESADVWLHRQMFYMDLEAGAPPDQYSKEGQKWGFPIYNWDAIAQSDYEWWKQRLAYATHFYHIYRIDHIVGFYRIWGIPLGKKAMDGHFVPENPTVWINRGDTIMRIMLGASTMLPIGEDLGTVPPEVRKDMKELGICGTKVMRWERDWNGNGHFLLPDEYTPLSMTTVSTHDSETVSQWWTNYPAEVKEYCTEKGWSYTAVLDPEYHFAILYDSHHTSSLFHINLLQEYLALFPQMVWPNPEDERINTPGVISDRNWSYRFRPSIEEIVGSEPLGALIQDLKS